MRISVEKKNGSIVKYARALPCFIHLWGATLNEKLLCFVGGKVWHAPCCVNTCCFPPSFLSGSSCDTIALRVIPIIFCVNDKVQFDL